MANDGQLLATVTFSGMFNSLARRLSHLFAWTMGSNVHIGVISDVFCHRHEAETYLRVFKSRFVCSANIFKSHIWSVTHGRRESELGFWDEGRI